MAYDYEKSSEIIDFGTIAVQRYSVLGIERDRGGGCIVAVHGGANSQRSVESPVPYHEAVKLWRGC